jgi:hypothetical protein
MARARVDLQTVVIGDGLPHCISAAKDDEAPAAFGSSLAKALLHLDRQRRFW